MEPMEKQYDPAVLEAKWYARWEGAGLFTPSSDGATDPDAPAFVITLPPPNVTGILHIGHCLGAGIMDALVRYYRMCGRPTLYIPGTDHASIATENKVVAKLREEGVDKRELGREQFLERAWKWADDHHDIIVSQFKRYGASLDWSREAFTMDEARNRAVLTAFVRLYEKGLIYRGDYMTNWSVAQQSAVSDEEVVHKEVQGKLWHFRYPLKDGGHLVVATTRPETMLGDTAVAVHPAAAKTAHLKGRTVVLPLVGREIPVIEDDHVDPEFGSGCVKVTPAHDPNDYAIGKRHALEFINVLNPDGTLNGNVPEVYRGLDRFVARKRVVADLEAAGLLEKVQDHVHMVGYHDRSDTIIEPYISRQWFLKMESLAAPAIEAVESGTIGMFPERWVGVYYNWMRNIRDWCISRQLWWGHRIPFFQCGACGHEMVQVEAPLHCGACSSADMRQDEDVLDTWFSSWLWTFSPLGWPEQTTDLRRFHPTSVLVTGADILFFWVARMIMASYEFLGEPPFTEVLYTGIVRDEKGRKLSKSLGNSPDPLELMDKYGADALRFVLIMLTPTGQDINFSDETCETGRNFCTKIWNATRLLLSNLDGFDLRLGAADARRMRRDLAPPPSREVDADRWFRELVAGTFGVPEPDASLLAPLELEDRWVLHRLAAAAQRVEREIEARRLNDAAYAGYDCFWNEFCDWYLEAIKPRLRGDDEGARRTALTVAFTVHAQLLRLLHPFLPYITEELWHAHPCTTGFVVTAPMPRYAGAAPLAEDAARFELARALVAAVRNLRSELGVPPGRRGHALLRCHEDSRADVDAVRTHVEVLAKLESVDVLVGEAPAQAVTAVVDHVEVFLPLEGLVDLDRERQRLGKERDGIQQRLHGVRAKLANEKFTAKAPADVIQRERDLESSLAQTLTKLEAQIDALGKGTT
jgi:valyl-tRNA synthetase